MYWKFIPHVTPSSQAMSSFPYLEMNFYDRNISVFNYQSTMMGVITSYKNGNECLVVFVIRLLHTY